MIHPFFCLSFAVMMLSVRFGREFCVADKKTVNFYSPGFPQGSRASRRPQAVGEERPAAEGEDIAQQDREAAGGRVRGDVSLIIDREVFVTGVEHEH